MSTKITLCFAAALVSGIAHAHTHLEKSTPADNAVLSQAPAKITLEFSEAARLTALRLKKDADNSGTKLEPLPKTSAATVSMPLAPLAPGKYTVEWRVVGDDSHIMSGKLHFELKAP